MVARQGNRLAATGCLIGLTALIVIFGIIVSWLWYRHWHDGKVNSERQKKERAALLNQARATADVTARALDTSRATDIDALTGVIWQHSKAPVITYDAFRHEFTATAAKSAPYRAAGILPGSGAGRLTRCYVFTYTHSPGPAWTSRVSEQENDVCRPSSQIGGRVGMALTRISSMNDELLTRAGVQNALDPTRSGSFDIRSVLREGNAMTISVNVSSSQTPVAQCYRFTRPTRDGEGLATAVPASSC
ncbi:hypothetical protein ACFTXB_27355 [Streptomyces sp. NPDC057074]|uniref:hypothetical protein n=1 Tax=Streptomyces sp. NPDC057074 TaxID=3346015 RepID=UPI00363FD1CE